jgi:dipeptidyl-peptidase-4
MNLKIRHLFISLSILLSPLISFSQAYTPITLSKIYQEYHFYPNAIKGIRSMADGEHYTTLESDRAIVRYDYKTGKNRIVLFSTDQLPAKEFTSFDDYIFSNDEKKVLLTTDKTQIYRHSFVAQYWIYDLVTKTINPLADSGKQQLATFSPDGLKVAFVKSNNLYYKNLVTNSINQVTTDGKINNIINGAPDWVYEEEFGFSQAYCWSPESRSLAFYRFDESQVRQFDMTIFNGLYPSVSRFKYPKAGEVNSSVSIKVYNLESGKTVIMNTGSETDQYIPRIKWSALPGKLCIILLNRLQNKVNVMLAEERTGESETIYGEENTRYISEVNDDYIYFTADRKHFIVLSERSGYAHYYLYTMNGKLINPVTQGNWDVGALQGIDEKNSTLYYVSNQASVTQQHVYAVRFDGTGQHRLSDLQGTNDAEFSSTYNYYINTWSDANTPPRYTLHRIDGTMIRVLEDNASLKKELKAFGFTKKEFIKIPVSADLELNAYIVKPPDFDSTRKYPLFISVYGGPESQDVIDSWDNELAWQQLLAQQGIIVACIDNRGTDGRGEDFRKSTYMQLGKLETEDQINAARYLGGKSWIDENRIGIWGWSYGGYMTLLCLTRGADVFKLGIAVAPVTNWRYYDTIYTERFMRKPQDNPGGYDNNSPINYAGELKGKLLLIHGTADDNVHVQNSMEMTERLVQENKQFQQFLYPDKNHGIYGENTRVHLFTMITEFIHENL